MQHGRWRAVILAAGRGPNDPMAEAFGIAHKCALPIAGKPMLAWVIEALAGADLQTPFVVSIDDRSAAIVAAGSNAAKIRILPSGTSAPASAIAGILDLGTYPVLITTGDHPLLTPPMIRHFLDAAEANGTDVLAGLATKETIAANYPETRRTYFNLGGTRVSGCNLFAVMNARGLRMLEAWQELEKNRKKPWKLVAAFGVAPLFHFMAGSLTPDRAFSLMSKKLGIKVAPVFMPFAEAAIDVDKPSDHQLAEQILQRRSAPA